MNIVGWLMGLEPTTTGTTILTYMHFAVLIGADKIYINQQLTDVCWVNNQFLC